MTDKPKEIEYAECPICSVVFQKKQTRQKYCSPKCSHEAKVRRESVYARERKAKMKTVKCKYCGKEFRSKNRTETFCSLQCRDSYAVNAGGNKTGSLDSVVIQMKRESFTGSYGQYVALKYMKEMAENKR